jgi:hypothetical protein
LNGFFCNTPGQVAPAPAVSRAAFDTPGSYCHENWPGRLRPRLGGVPQQDFADRVCFPQALAQYTTQCVGVDISENMVATYNARAENQVGDLPCSLGISRDVTIRHRFSLPHLPHMHMRPTACGTWAACAVHTRFCHPPKGAASNSATAACFLAPSAGRPRDTPAAIGHIFT